MFVLIPESIPGGRHFSCEVASSNFGEKLWASELSSDFDQGQMTSNLYKLITFCWRCWKSESFVIQLPLACRHCFSPEKHFRGSCFEHLVQFFIVASLKNCNFMITLKSPEIAEVPSESVPPGPMAVQCFYFERISGIIVGNVIQRMESGPSEAWPPGQHYHERKIPNLTLMHSSPGCWHQWKWPSVWITKPLPQPASRY